MRISPAFACLAAARLFLGLGPLPSAELGSTPEGIPAQRAEQIRAACPATPRVAPRKPRRVLIWNTPPHLMEKDPHKGYCIPYGTCAFRTLGQKSGAFEPVVGDDLALLAPESLRTFDAIVLNNASGAWIVPDDEALPRLGSLGSTKEAVEAALRRSLLDWVAEGGGLFACHFAIGANPHWPEFHELLGAKFTGHPWNEEVSVHLEEPEHPLLAAFQGKGFRLADEIYQFGPPYDRAKVRVLLSLDTSRTNMGASWIERDDGDFAQAWVKSHGKGRVLYAGFGHRTEVWWHPAVLRFFLDGIQFAAGDLDAPTAPRDAAADAARFAAEGVRRRPGPTSPEERARRMAAGGVTEPTEEQVRRIESAAPAAEGPAPAKPRRVLVWGHAWTHGPNPFAERAIEALGRKSGAFEATVSDDPRLLLADRLPRFDVLVLNNIHEPDPFLPADLAGLDPEQQAAARKLDQAVKASILDFVRNGKGLVGIHAAAAALQGWTEYGELIGGSYASHIEAEVLVRIEDPSHPAVACLEGKPFRIRDEVYVFGEPYSRSRLKVLASLDLNGMPDPGKRPDGDYAVSWIREEGKGRVFYTTLGHAAETYWNPLFLRHLLAGIRWAAGD